MRDLLFVPDDANRVEIETFTEKPEDPEVIPMWFNRDAFLGRRDVSWIRVTDRQLETLYRFFPDECFWVKVISVRKGDPVK